MNKLTQLMLAAALAANVQGYGTPLTSSMRIPPAKSQRQKRKAKRRSGQYR